MTFPTWADAELSNELPGLRSQGEGQLLEFKEAFPEQAHVLGKEIAAFATSGGGRILIGVSDMGNCVGLEAADPSSRDRLVERAEGIVGTVRPMVNANVLLASESGKTVLCIDVLKQHEPVYYYDFRPYIRDGRRSRPAEPGEVKECVWAHPSSEFKRRAEETRLRQSEAILEMSAERIRSADKLAAESRRRFLDRLHGP